MLKVIFSVIGSVFITTSALVIFFWRDSQYEPSKLDLMLYFLLIPLVISLVLLTPYLLIKWQKHRKEKMAAQEKQALDVEDNIEDPIELVKSHWVKLKLYSTSIESSLGKDDELIQAVQDLQGPDLDSDLVDATGNPLLSYRITELDLDAIQELDLQLSEDSAMKRIYALIVSQLEQHSHSILSIAEHLKHSTLYYDTQLAYEYKMHPAWYNPDADTEESEQEVSVEPISKLNRINVVLILSEHLLHHWDEHQSTTFFNEYLDQFGILKQHIKVKYLYLSKLNSLDIFLDELTNISLNIDQVSMLFVVDSELSQDIVDEKIWVKPNFTAAEFCCSCITSSTEFSIQNNAHDKKLEIAFNQPKLLKAFETLDINKLPQFEQDQAFVSVLEDPKVPKVFKKLQFNFGDSGIENQHFYYSKSILGDSDELAGLFGFMLALQFEEPKLSMIYSTEHPSTQIFVQSVNE